MLRCRDSDKRVKSFAFRLQLWGGRAASEGLCAFTDRPEGQVRLPSLRQGCCANGAETFVNALVGCSTVL